MRPRVILPTGLDLKAMLVLNELLSQSAKGKGLKFNWSSLLIAAVDTTLYPSVPVRPGLMLGSALAVTPGEPRPANQTVAVTLTFPDHVWVHPLNITNQAVLYDPALEVRVELHGSSALVVAAFQDTARDDISKDWRNRLKVAGFLLTLLNVGCFQCACLSIFIK